MLLIWLDAKTFDEDLLRTLIDKVDARPGASPSPAPSASALASGASSGKGLIAIASLAMSLCSQSPPGHLGPLALLSASFIRRCAVPQLDVHRSIRIDCTLRCPRRPGESIAASTCVECCIAPAFSPSGWSHTHAIVLSSLDRTCADALVCADANGDAEAEAARKAAADREAATNAQVAKIIALAKGHMCVLGPPAARLTLAATSMAPKTTAQAVRVQRRRLSSAICFNNSPRGRRAPVERLMPA